MLDTATKSPVSRIVRHLFWLTAGLSLAACGGETLSPPGSPNQQQNQSSAEARRDAEDKAKQAAAQRLYAEAMAEMEDKDWESATSYFEQIARDYVGFREGTLAQLRLADVAYGQEKFAEAVSGYRQYIKDHRTDPEVVYARYRICKALFEQFGDSIMLPPQEERDLAAAVDGHAALIAFLKEYPNYRWAPELAYMLNVTSGLLARHELYVARFYLRSDQFAAAAARCLYAIEHYRTSGMAPEALVLLGETYLRMHRQKDAKDAFSRVLSEYPESAFTIAATNFLAHLSSPQN